MVGRRSFLAAAAGMVCGGGSQSTVSSGRGASSRRRSSEETAQKIPAFSVVPVVGDGRWIWTRPPVGETGYLEPRRFRLRVGVEITGGGPSADIVSTTPVPIGLPEQTIDSERIETEGTVAVIEQVAPHARRLLVAAERLQKGVVVSAVAHFELTLRKQFFDYRRAMFPAEQKVPYDVRAPYLGDSPGIQTRTAALVALAKSLGGGAAHPWDLGLAAAEWVGKNIRPRLGPYTSVTAALEHRVGDCEEMAGVFVAICRAAGIPARLVWIPNHVWSEFYLTDEAGGGHWIPVHTACYPWFGWTGVHELVLQKGDRLRLRDHGSLVRLQPDRTRAIGARPDVRYLAELTPLPPADDAAADPGPGARRKIETGEWKVLGEHPLDRYVRR